MNKLADAEKKLTPFTLLGNYLNKDVPLKSIEDWLKPEFKYLDEISLATYLRQRGASAEAIRIIGADNLSRDIETASALEFIRKRFYYRWAAGQSEQGGIVYVKDGTSALPNAMAASLKSPVLIDKNVHTINATHDRVTVKCKDGTTISARACLSTIPLSVMRQIKISAPATTIQRAAWRDIPYSDLLLVYMEVLEPFWKIDGLTPDTWTDGPIKRILHLSGGNQGSNQGHGNLMVFINGSGLERYRKLSEKEIGSYVQAEFTRIRPAAKGRVRVTKVFDWGRYPFAQGYVSYYLQGQVGRFNDVLSQPAGALFFAGEHCGRLHVGMEAACESAEAAAVKMLAALDQ